MASPGPPAYCFNKHVVKFGLPYSLRIQTLLGLASLFCALATRNFADGATNLDLARQLNQTFVEVAEKITPTVVVVSVVQKAARDLSRELEDSPDDRFPREFWRRFHERFRETPSERAYGEGSGVILRKDGYILTNRHVVEEAETIEVRLKDGRTFKAKVQGVDPQSDVAVLKIDASDLPTARLADSDQTRVGEFAIAIGAPFSLDYSVTVGHVSAKGRANIVPVLAGGGLMDQDFIQTDANINPGNSGGPLVNLDGEVIGVNTLIRGLRTGIGFAIPSNLAREVSDQIIAQGKFTRAWLGVRITSLKDDPDFRNLVEGVDAGVIVQAILPDSPAVKSDLRPGDVITAVAGHRVTTPQELRNEIRGKQIGQPITLDVFRANKTLQVNVTPGEWTEQTPVVAATEKEPTTSNQTPPGLGITVQVVTDELAEKFGVSQTEGVMVTSVEQDSLAARKDIKPGDVITAINHRPTATLRQFNRALARADLRKGVLINLVSGKTARFEILKAGD